MKDADPSAVPRTWTVLVVDDEPHLRSTMADILSDHGYQVVTADTGEAAVRLARKRPFDIALIDVRMPGMDGFETFRRIRGRHPAVRVIMMSAYSTNEFRRVADDEGAQAFMRKPIDVDELLSRLSGWVAK